MTIVRANSAVSPVDVVSLSKIGIGLGGISPAPVVVSPIVVVPPSVVSPSIVVRRSSSGDSAGSACHYSACADGPGSVVSRPPVMTTRNARNAHGGQRAPDSRLGALDREGDAALLGPAINSFDFGSPSFLTERNTPIVIVRRNAAAGADLPTSIASMDGRPRRPSCPGTSFVAAGSCPASGATRRAPAVVATECPPE